MARRSTPERIDAARRAAIRNSLISDGLSPETADAWIAACEVQAAEDKLEHGAAHWQAGWDWIAAQRNARRQPP